jgi:hypothetical protein
LYSGHVAFLYVAPPVPACEEIHQQASQARIMTSCA